MTEKIKEILAIFEQDAHTDHEGRDILPAEEWEGTAKKIAALIEPVDDLPAFVQTEEYGVFVRSQRPLDGDMGAILNEYGDLVGKPKTTKSPKPNTLQEMSTAEIKVWYEEFTQRAGSIFNGPLLEEKYKKRASELWTELRRREGEIWPD